MNVGDLRLGRIQDRLDLGLLISGQVQLFSDPPLGRTRGHASVDRQGPVVPAQ